MDGWQFGSSVIGSLAWPTAAVGLGLLLRQPLTTVLASPTIKRWKVGPAGIEIEQWDRQAERARDDLPRETQPSATQAEGLPPPEDSLMELAEVSPITAVIEGFKRIEDRLVSLLVQRGWTAPGVIGASELVRQAVSMGLIDSQTAHGIGGLQVLRDLAAHGAAPERLDPARAKEYAAMVNAILFTIPMQ
jgi:hypothetical protein